MIQLHLKLPTFLQSKSVVTNTVLYFNAVFIYGIDILQLYNIKH